MTDRDTTEAVRHSGGVIIDGMVTRMRRANGETLLVPDSNGRSKVGGITGSTGKAAEGERESDGPEVAGRRGNARGAKRPRCEWFFRQHERQGRHDKSA
jgi:hypothetical protein